MSKDRKAQKLETVTRRRLLQVMGTGGMALAVGARPPAHAQTDGLAPEAGATVRTRLTDTWGLQHPLVSAGMGFLALPELVAAVSEAGGLGVLGVAPDPPPIFAERIAQIRALTQKPFGVDFFLGISPTLGPITQDGHIDVAAAEGVDLAVFHFGLPTAAWIATLRSAGVQIWAQVASIEEARAAMAVGVDGLVAQGKEAGGHTRSTTPLNHLLRDIREEVGDETLVLAAGGIATGADVVVALAHGADGVWVGTRFVASEEAYAHPEYKRRIVAAKRQDTVITTLFGPELPCEPYRLLRNTATDAPGVTCDQLPAGPPIGTTVLFPGTSAETPGVPMPPYSTLPPTPDTVGDFDAMGMPAGESVHHIHDIKPAARIVADMMAEASGIIQAKLGR